MISKKAAAQNTSVLPTKVFICRTRHLKRSSRADIRNTLYSTVNIENEILDRIVNDCRDDNDRRVVTISEQKSSEIDYY